MIIKHKKKVIAALILGLAITLTLQATLLAEQCYGIREKVFRLHILANSDSPADQQLKLKVRDALLTYGGPLLSGAQNKEEAAGLANQHINELQQIAQNALNKYGSDQSVSITVADTYFNTRYYQTVTLPAGTYTALRVVLGEGKGKNWWCVMFPNLCIPTATDSKGMEDVLTPGQTKLVEGGNQYKIKFKTIEFAQSALNKCKAWW
ncbi:MAG: stage II sporulation protein R [Clostridia bacterium]|nr:stage II sporulation protein R [Clostridia bacterium]